MVCAKTSKGCGKEYHAISYTWDDGKLSESFYSSFCSYDENLAFKLYSDCKKQFILLNAGKHRNAPNSQLLYPNLERERQILGRVLTSKIKRRGEDNSRRIRAVSARRCTKSALHVHSWFLACLKLSRL